MTFEQGARVLLMKVGTHAGEDLGSIVARKRAEIQAAGFSLWGYGGNTCHPRTMVQPFARTAAAPIVLAMQAMHSNHFAAQVRAEEWSADGVHWQPVHPDIHVLGSRFALAIASLDDVDTTIDLAATRVAVGNSRGKLGSAYVNGRVDKACLEVAADADGPSRPLNINLQAQLVDPFAVFLRNG